MGHVIPALEFYWSSTTPPYPPSLRRFRSDLLLVIVINVLLMSVCLAYFVCLKGVVCNLICLAMYIMCTLYYI